MDTLTESTSARRPVWWQVRPPALFYVIGATFVVGGVLQVVEGGPLAFILLEFVVGALIWAAATATVIQRRRTGEPAAERPPLAQESDPNRR